MLLLFALEEISEAAKAKVDNRLSAEKLIPSYRNEFLSFCEKLKKEGCNSSCKKWWRFRFYEFLGCDKKSKNHEDWKQKTEKYNTWDFFWSDNEKEITAEL